MTLASGGSERDRLPFSAGQVDEVHFFLGPGRVEQGADAAGDHEVGRQGGGKGRRAERAFQAVVLVSASYGLALVYSRQKLRGLPPLVAPTSQMLLATLFLLPFSLLFDRPFSLPAPSLPAAGSVLALALLGTTVAFIVYYRLVQTADASYASMVTYLAPIFGVLLGVAVLGERLAWNAFVAFALILLGVMVVNGVFRELPRPARLREQMSG